MTNKLIKKACFFIHVLILFSLLTIAASAQPGTGSKPVKIIYDTDIDLDVDDAGALAVLHALADNGEAELLGVIVNSPTPYGATTVSAINRYYGRPGIPVGDMPVEEYVYDKSFDRWYRNYAVNTPYGNFNLPIFRRFENNIKTRKDVWSGVQLYRKLLSEAPNKSVTIAAVGLLTVLEDLMYSKPDKYSKLNGKELIKLKVKELVCMTGGNQPAPNRASFNWGFEGRGDAERISKEWPTAMFLSPMGGKVATGARLSTETPGSNPVRAAYELFLKPPKHKNRPSWDQIAVYYAVRGAGEIFEEPPGRRLDVTAVGGANEWRDGSYTWRDAKPGEPLHVKIVQKISDESMGKIIEDLMVQLPKNNKNISAGSFIPTKHTDTNQVSKHSGAEPHSISVALNEEPIKSEDLFVITNQETVKWNAPGGEGPEIIVIDQQQKLPEQYDKIIRSGKSALVLVPEKYKKSFTQIKNERLKMQLQETEKASGTVVFILTQQDSAPWYSVNMNIK